MAAPVDVLIIGGGPAGLSTALTLARQLHTVTLFDSGSYRNDSAEYQHMVLGFDHQKPSQYRAAARENILSRYKTVTIQDVAVTTAKKLDEDLFELTDANDKTYRGKKLVLATGVEDLMPDMPGFKESWGKGIFHCLFCKGFEEQGAESAGLLAIGCMASVPMALEGARHAVPLAKVTTIYTDGNEDFAKDVSAAVAGTDRMVVDTRPIEKLSQSSSGAEMTVHFKDGSTKVEGFLATHLDTKTRGPFAEQLGLEMTPGGDVKTAPPFSATNVKGVFAVGDCGQSMKVISAAAASGSAAAAACSSQVLAVSLGQEPLF